MMFRSLVTGNFIHPGKEFCHPVQLIQLKTAKTLRHKPQLQGWWQDYEKPFQCRINAERPE
jgi:hypothetical protein